MPEIVAPLGGSMEARIAEYVWKFLLGQQEEAIDWLKRLGCADFHKQGYGEYHFTGLTGIRCGLSPGLDPNNAAVMFAIALFGEWWPFVVPRLQKIINAEWRERRQEVENYIMNQGGILASKPLPSGQQRKLGI